MKAPQIIRRYFDMSAVPGHMRRVVFNLMSGYLLGALMMFILAAINIVWWGFEGREIKIFSHLLMGVGLLVSMHATKRGYGLAAINILSLLCLVVTGHRMIQTGGLNAMSTVAILPFVVYTFLHARRHIQFYFVASFVLTLGLHLYLHISSPQGLESLHGAYTPIFYATFIHIAMLVVMLMVIDVEKRSLARIEMGNRELEAATHDAIEQSSEAERAMQEALMHRQAKANYLANMSHELRTPLSTIISYSELLDEDLEDESPEIAELLSSDVMHIRSAGQHLLRRINDILDLSRLEAGKMPIFKGDVSLMSVLSGAEEFASLRAASDRGTELKLTLPEADAHLSDVQIHCDELLLTKLLAHLWLYLKQSGPISVHVRLKEDCVELACLVRVWTIPPGIESLALMEEGNLHMLLYEEIKRVLELDIVEPGQSKKASKWKIYLPFSE